MSASKLRNSYIRNKTILPNMKLSNINIWTKNRYSSKIIFRNTKGNLSSNVKKLANTLMFSGNNNKLKLLGRGEFGRVYSVTNGLTENRYVIKVVSFSTKDDIDKLMREIQIGSLSEINTVGVKTHGFSFVDKYTLKSLKVPIKYGNGSLGGAIIIMDHFLKGRNDIHHLTLNKYMQTFYQNSCPSSNHKLIKFLKRQLKIFYKITKGYHGDLHGDNMQVLLKKMDGESSSIENIIISDYGSHIPFRNLNNNALQSACLKDIFDLINLQFIQNFEKYHTPSLLSYPEGSRIPIIPTIRGRQPFRPNTYMLKYLNQGQYSVNGKLRQIPNEYANQSILHRIKESIPKKVFNRHVVLTK